MGKGFISPSISHNITQNDKKINENIYQKSNVPSVQTYSFVDFSEEDTLNDRVIESKRKESVFNHFLNSPDDE